MAAFVAASPEPLHAIGLLPRDFWGNLVLELQAHGGEVAAAASFLALLVLARAALAAPDRRHLRLGFFLFGLYFLSLPIRAELLSLELATAYRAARLIAAICLVWGAIGMGGVLVFDLVGKRLELPRILRDLTISVASLVALVVLLSRFGVNLLSIVTTSAVLTAVIGLALQDTLGHLFSGVALQVEASFTIGDWIRVDDRPIGKVREIRWRSTLIQTRNGDLIVIPNGLLTKGVLTNFNKDELQHRQWVYFSTHLRHPPNLVQQVVLDCLRDIPNVSADPPPDCIFWSFEDSSAKYAVRYRLIDFLRDDPTDSEVRKRIWYALHRSQIEIPYPAQNLFVTELTAAREQGKSELERARRLEAIAKASIFAPLDEHERAHLAEGLRHLIFGAGEVILRAGEAGDSLYIIRSGRVVVKIGSNGLEREVATLGEGEFFGEMSLMTGDPRYATVVARGDVECYVVDRALFHGVLQQKASLADDIGRLLAERGRALAGEREDLAAEVARVQSTQQALMHRIKGFFGLG